MRPSQLSSAAHSSVDVAANPKIRRQRVSADSAAFKIPRRTTRRSAAATPAWAIPKTKDWDILKVLHCDELLAPDHLLNVSPANRGVSNTSFN